jgi:methylase of polypeptide subunit release factors
LPQGAYDRITCNPPLLPIPPGVPYPAIGDGGFDGLQFVERIFGELETRLAEQGKCLLLGLSLADPVPQIEKLCARALPPGFTYTLYLLTRQPMDQYLKAIVTTISRLYPGQNQLQISRRFQTAYARAGYTDVVSYYLVVSRQTTNGSSCVCNLTRGNASQTYWFVGGA